MVPLLEGVNRNWIGNGLYAYDIASYTVEVCDAATCDPTPQVCEDETQVLPALQPWKGYWIWLHRQGDGGGNKTYELLVPAP